MRNPEPISLGSQGGAYEAFAFDIRDMPRPRFFLTEDEKDGALQRWTPDNTNNDLAAKWNTDPWSILHGAGVTDYLYLQPSQDGTNTGTFLWIADEQVARKNAESYYRYTEGIQADLPFLYFVCKEDYRLFRLNLDTQTYAFVSTRAGLFDGEPDQITHILQEDGSKLLYFSEDSGWAAGVHARDEWGRFYTILEGPDYQPGKSS
jgi:hypothetical protein